MEETTLQSDVSSDTDSSDILEGTPVKEDQNKIFRTLIVNKSGQNMGTYRQKKNVIYSSDSDESVEERESSKCDSKEIRKSLHPVTGTGRYRENVRIIESDDTDSDDDSDVSEDEGKISVSDNSTVDVNEAEGKISVSDTSSVHLVEDESKISISDNSSVENSVELNTSIAELSIKAQKSENVENSAVDSSVMSGPTSRQAFHSDKKEKGTPSSEARNEDSSIMLIKECSPVNVAKQSANSESESNFKPALSSTPISDVSKPGMKDEAVNAIERSFQSVAISEKKSSPNSSSDFHSLIVQKKALQSDIVSVSKEIEKLRMILKTVNLSNLPDRGIRIQIALSEKETRLKKLMDRWQSSNFDAVPESAEGERKPHVDITVKGERMIPGLPKDKDGVPRKTAFLGSMPSTAGMGKKALETHRAEKAMTIDTLKHLHGSLKSCPEEDVISEDPRALKSSVQLMPHQKHALAWLMWREREKPYGGILADDMGLGKTLTMISLVLKTKEEKENDSEGVEKSDSEDEDSESSWATRKRKFEKGGTLVVCPASLINQWEGEVHRRVKRGVLDVEVYHGANRETKPRRLAKRDLVITTYNILRSEGSVVAAKKGTSSYVDYTKQGAVFGVKWERIILDEAHTIRNHKSQTSIAACSLKGKHRWVLTGTPVHNKEMDLYSLLKFLRCSPFDELVVWRRWVDNKSAGGMQRLNTVINSLMLRRTKEQLQSKGTLSCLPKKEIMEVVVTLDKEEFEVYERVLNFSRTLFAQFLAQKVENEQGLNTYTQSGKYPYAMTEELQAMHNKLNSMNNIKSFEILVLLLRLRQICCHPGLIENMLDKETCENDGIVDDTGLDVDLLSQLSKMGLEERIDEEVVDADKVVKKKVLVTSNPVFKKSRISSKMRALFKELNEKVLSQGENAVIVSQFTSMLDLVHQHLKEMRVKCLLLTGAVPVKERSALVEEFNGSSSRPMVMLLSLTAGGVGLNLIGGNHLLLLDPHWNPQLEAQAFDRVYRVGQKKDVQIYKFICEETIEKQIKSLQQKKMAIATSVLTGVRHQGGNKLSLDDLKVLFNFHQST
ncbi:transcription termination factor 2 isoform X2 [Periplaneta americana]|uniref:transcription termination factor 2 isoform X2 n=1 Tax=Periplaneta americana TaxID=6978 RepID=UPI0037E8A72A